MKLPIGISDFKQLVTYSNPETGRSYLWIDKTLLIRELIGNGTAGTIITRPRRFGKTLNMSMLHYFCASTVNGESTAGLFDNLKIAQYPEIMALQGTYPVISLTFKGIKKTNYNDFYEAIIEYLAQEYQGFLYLLDSAQLSNEDKNRFKKLLYKEASRNQYETSLGDLVKMLKKHHGKKAIVLIDEYDVPIQSSYLNGYYEPCIDFMRSFFTELKDNTFLEQAIVTGILRVAKESLFSGWNNPDLCSILEEEYAQYFGFTDDEVDYLLHKTNLIAKKEEIKHWYNGYNIGNITIYNPWSLINCLNKKGEIALYWINTSSNDLIKKLIQSSTAEFREELAALLNGSQEVRQTINQHLVFTDLDDNNTDAIWSLLLLSGYLTVFNRAIPCGTPYQLKVPNLEIMFYFREIISAWLSGKHGYNWYVKFLQDLTLGNIANFSHKLKAMILETLSYHDVTINTQEQFYHAFLLGLVVGLRDTHEIYSNKEGGFGRFDLMLVPKDLNKLGIVIELKVTPDHNALEKTAQLALAQISAKHYDQMLKQKGIFKILHLGIAFSGKDLLVLHKLL